MGSTYSMMFHPDVTPYPDSKPTFDPQFGFKEPRQPKVMIATREELESAKIDKDFQDYCAHHFINFLACKAKHAPFMRYCAHEHHAWQHCLYEETVDQYKDYERERRLLERAKRIERRKQLKAERARTLAEAEELEGH